MKWSLALMAGGLFFAHRDCLAQLPAGSDTITGAVVTDSSAAVNGATVNVTRAPDRAFLTTTTDSSGRFRIIFPDGTGDYLVYASMAGYKAARNRIRRGADGQLPAAKLVLESSVQKLATVQVQAEKPIPIRDRGIGTESGEAAGTVDGVTGAVPPGLAGNLDAMALTVPGVSQIPGGISVLGMSSATNSSTLNGMAFSGASLPRDALTVTRIATSTYDPARGGFAGAQTSVELGQGNLFSQRTAHITFDDPSLQYGGAVASGLDHDFRSFQMSTGGNGSVDDDKIPYNFALQGAARSAGVASLETASASELQSVGLGRTAASTLLSTLGSIGIPVHAALPALGASSEIFSVVGRIDHAPYDWATFKDAKTTWGLVGFGNVESQSNTGITPLAIAASGVGTRNISGGVQALYSAYVKTGYLTDLRSTLSVDDRRTTSNDALPAAFVRLQTQSENGDTLFSSVGIGGSGTAGSVSRGLTWETIGSTEFYWKGRAAHHVRLTASSRLDSYSNSSAQNSLGSFFYNSLDDLVANRPADFNRVLSSPVRRSSEWAGFTSLSDSWSFSRRLRFLYGARLEANQFLDKPTFNSNIATAFGIRNDDVPNTMHVSPRVGFTWALGGRGGGYRVGALGKFYLTTARYLRGGIGEFRNSLPANLIVGAKTNTGLSDGTSSIDCIGPAAPQSDWGAYLNEAGIPTSCAGSSSSSPTFTDAAKRVVLFTPSYSPARSWRANLAYSSTHQLFTYTLEGNYSLGVALPDYVNLNFIASPHFLTDDGRSVFVSRASIDPLTGAVSPVESRRNASFGDVIARGSAGRSRTSQATFSIVPNLPGYKYFLRGSYTVTASRATFNGFGEPSFASPLLRETARSDFDSRHQFLVQAGGLFKGFAFTLFTRIQSGLPFTPIASGDVNGDGIANDKAFIYSASGGATGTALSSFLASAPAPVRNCLEKQIGGVAGRNSCNGPWAATMNAQVSSYRKLPLLGTRGNVALAFSNPLGGIDRVLHGESGMHGWGSISSPDPTLYYVRGFDPATSRFLYDVNPRFGRVRLSDALSRSPFRVTLDISLDIGTPLPVQQVSRWLTPGRNGRKGPKLTVDDLKKRYMRTINDPYRQLLEETDSLLLSRDQSDAITAADVRYRAGMDSIWTAAATTLAALPDNFDAAVALKTQEDASDAAWEFTRLSVRASFDKLLNPIQIKLAGGIATMLYHAEKPVHIRTYMN